MTVTTVQPCAACAVNLTAHGRADRGWLADVDRQRLRDAMGAEAFEAAYTAGRTLDLAEVLAALGRKEETADRRERAYLVRP